MPFFRFAFKVCILIVLSTHVSLSTVSTIEGFSAVLDWTRKLTFWKQIF